MLAVFNATINAAFLRTGGATRKMIVTMAQTKLNACLTLVPAQNSGDLKSY